MSITEFQYQLASAVKTNRELDVWLNQDDPQNLSDVEASLELFENAVQSLADPARLEHIQAKRSKLEKHKAWQKRHRKKVQQQRVERSEKQRERRLLSITLASAPEGEEPAREPHSRTRIKELSRLLHRLTVLRDLRRKRLSAQGHFFPEEGNEFFDKIKAWHEQEEKQEEGKKKPDETWSIHSDDHWQHMPLDKKAYRFWTSGNLERLRRTRQDWDQYLVHQDVVGPEAKIPPKFVEPVPPANWVWATHLEY
ncbi:hypothetical protein DFQ28_010596 [Apophysomyces sp. BC1034]|nr:hypothetical protein DFQ30_005348 [Apophysomyces sp. BC1015]KAG0183485.1 hypothetical protein DFQ29_002539 [Apophysomyces sp. BC1021]KAG0194512.1 hypothetical protein DFQ28_010596 [Apophysomyces sp. BC1034]